jgi:ubiquitin carboxyl-terminal hydrolase 7
VNGNSGLAVSQRHSLHEMTASNLYALQNQSFLLFYELLDISLEELEMKKYVKLSYLENGIKEHGPHSILIEKTATLKELAAALFTKLELSETDVNRQYRFVEVSNNRRAKVFSLNDVISFLNEFAFLYLESFDEEECGLLEGKVEGKMVEVFHFFKDVYRSHSIPFTFLLIPVNQIE